MLFCLRGLRGQMVWDFRPLKLAFWSLNIGLALMALLTLLPRGRCSCWPRSSTGMRTRVPIVELLVWMRMPRDRAWRSPGKG